MYIPKIKAKIYLKSYLLWGRVTGSTVETVDNFTFNFKATRGRRSRASPGLAAPGASWLGLYFQLRIITR
jgi:hypothetical protein